jgi:hypothetical protein
MEWEGKGTYLEKVEDFDVVGEVAEALGHREVAGVQVRLGRRRPRALEAAA